VYLLLDLGQPGLPVRGFVVSSHARRLFSALGCDRLSGVRPAATALQTAVGHNHLQLQIRPWDMRSDQVLKVLFQHLDGVAAFVNEPQLLNVAVTTAQLIEQQLLQPGVAVQPSRQRHFERVAQVM